MLNVIDGRPGAGRTIGMLRTRPLGRFRRIARVLDAYELVEPMRVLTARGEAMGRAGDVLLVMATGPQARREAWLAPREVFETDYTPVAEGDRAAA